MHQVIINFLFYFHILVIAYYIWWFFLPVKIFSKITEFHRKFVIIIFLSQIILLFKCPLTWIENYFRFLWWLDLINQPFTSFILEKYFWFFLEKKYLVLLITFATLRALQMWIFETLEKNNIIINKILIRNFIISVFDKQIFKNFLKIFLEYRKNKNFSFWKFILQQFYIHNFIRLTKYEDKIIWYSLLQPVNKDFTTKFFIENIRWKDKFEWLLKNDYLVPLNINISITEECPYNCKHCSAWNRKEWKIMEFQNLKNSLNELCEWWVWVIWITWGEPLTYPNLSKVLSEIDFRNTNIYIYTTWYWLTEKFATDLKKSWIFWLCISFDSLDSKIMDDFRWLKWASKIALDAIKVSVKSWLYTMVQIVATKEKIASWEIEKVLRFLKNFWVHEVRVLQILPAWRLIDKKFRKIFLNKEEFNYLVKLQKLANNDYKNYPKTFFVPFFESKHLFWCNAWKQYFYIETSWNIYPCDFVEKSFWNIFKDWWIKKVWEKMSKNFSSPLNFCLSFDKDKKKLIYNQKWIKFFEILK